MKMKYIDGHYTISNNNTVYLLSTDIAVSMMIYNDDNPLFFVYYNPYYGKITIEKTNKDGHTTKQKVSKTDREYYTNIMNNFILANTNFVLDNV